MNTFVRIIIMFNKKRTCHFIIMQTAMSLKLIEPDKKYFLVMREAHRWGEERCVTCSQLYEVEEIDQLFLYQRDPWIGSFCISKFRLLLLNNLLQIINGTDWAFNFIKQSRLYPFNFKVKMKFKRSNDILESSSSD